MHLARMTAQDGNTPPALLQLAGHPVRWRLIRELARSDRIVNELTSLVGEPQNLVSYHLGKLREARLVFARQSSADRRDTYYGLDLTRLANVLSATGAALHPGLGLTMAARSETHVPARVLFLCTGNSARSQIAEVLTRARSGGAVMAVSAGSDPKPVHANAVRVLRDEYGLDLSRHTSKHLDVFDEERFDWVVTLCDRVREICPEFSTEAVAVHWSIANPASGDADEISYPLFQQAAAELATRIDVLLAAISDRASANP